MSNKSPAAKICAGCNIEKLAEDFSPSTRGMLGLRTHCKLCHNAQQRDRRAHSTPGQKAARQASSRKKNLANYGLTEAEYADRLENHQQYACAICGIIASFAPRGKLFVDHNHETGKVRELLCCNCNALLGYAKESIATMLAAIAYLRKHNGA